MYILYFQQTCHFDDKDSHIEGHYLCGDSFHLCKNHFEKYAYCPNHTHGHWKYWSIEDDKKRRVSKDARSDNLHRVHHTCHHAVLMTAEQKKKKRKCPILDDGGERKP